MTEFSVLYRKISDGSYRLDYRHPVTKKRCRPRVKTKAEAERRKNELIIQYSQGRLPSSSKTYVGHLMDFHLKEVPDTRIISYNSKRFRSFMDYFRLSDVAELGKFELKCWFSEIQKESNLSEKTLNRTKAQLSHFFNWAVERGYIRDTPLKYIRFSEHGFVTRPVKLSLDEIKGIMRKAKGFEDGKLYNFLYVCAHTAARRGELLALKWEDIDFDLGTITFWVTKNKKVKRLPLNPQLRTFLKGLPKEDTFVFTNRLNRRLTEHTLRDYIDKFKAQQNFEKNWNTKSFRHSFSHLAKINGWDPHAIQIYMGHETLQMTMGTYGLMDATEIKHESPIDI